MNLLKVRFPPTKKRPGERFWIKKTSETKNYITGIVQNDLVVLPYKFGDKIRVKKSQIIPSR